MKRKEAAMAKKQKRRIQTEETVFTLALEMAGVDDYILYSSSDCEELETDETDPIYGWLNANVPGWGDAMAMESPDNWAVFDKRGRMMGVVSGSGPEEAEFVKRSFVS